MMSAERPCAAHTLSDIVAASAEHYRHRQQMEPQPMVVYPWQLESLRHFADMEGNREAMEFWWETEFAAGRWVLRDDGVDVDE